jgi:SAM-dependent methyltransferase
MEPRRREVLFVGRLVPEKALETWLAVAARVAAARPDVRFTVAGDGARRSALEARATALGIAHRVAFLGRVPHAGLAPLYGRAAVLLLTSRSEGFGRVVVEAAAANTPAVAAGVGGVPDAVEHGVTGFVHAPDDVEGMAASVVALLDDPARRRALGVAAARHARTRFDPVRLRRDWVELLAGGPPAAAGELPPRRRTLRRWLSLARSRTSTLRWLEYDRLTALRLDGRVLDLGGGRRSGYAGLLDVRGRLDSVNVDPRVQPTVRADLDRALPFRAGAFDHLLSLNTLEHVAGDEHALAEGLRVLRPGGSFHLIVPFLYRVHASPSDFHRHTAAWWRAALVRHGARADALAIEPLVWDRAVSAHSFFGTSRVHRTLRALLAARAAVADLGRRGERLPGSHRGLADYALGYYIHGTT